MKHILLVPIACFLLSLTAFSQQPDRWKGLVLDECTPEDAIKTLGTPFKDQANQQLKAFGNVSRWIAKRQKDKIFRTLEYKFGKDEGVQKAVLYFEDGKLVRIMLDLKAGEISPNALGRLYGIELAPMVGAMDIAMSPKDYERNQGKVYTKSFPTVYYLVGVSEKSFISGMVSNVSFGSVLAKSMGVGDQPGNFPGKVEYIDLISRKLEDRDGADILK